MSNFGQFSGDPITQWLHIDPDEHRKMRLVEPFWYDDPHGVRWLAPVSSEIDGASIPRPLWTLVGSPFTGNYRRASIVHDVACVDKARPDRDVHRMFYFACRADGVDEPTAQIMYAAIRMFGPRWLTRAQIEEQWAGSMPPFGAAAMVPPPSAEEQARLEQAFASFMEEVQAGKTATSFDELEAQMDAQLAPGGTDA